MVIDSHGNMTSVGSGTTPLRLCYDSSDRNTCMTQRDANGNGIAMYYDRDVQGRIIGRYKNTLANWNATAAGDFYYHYTASGDTPDYTRDSTWAIVEKTLQLPGGVLATIKPQQTGNTQKQYSLPNNHGDTLLTANAAGTNTSNGNGPLNSFTYDLFGTPLPGSTLPANTGNGSYGWVGQHEKMTESEYVLAPIQMGARLYIPQLGRFTQVDPIEGGTENNYVYPTDPVNEFDLSGEFSFKDAWRNTKKAVSGAARATVDAAKAAGSWAINARNQIADWSAAHPTETNIIITIATAGRGGGKGSLGKGSYSRTLPDGRVRDYGKFKPARKQGEMAGARKVKETNPKTGKKRYWYETLDRSGNVRTVRPFDKRGYRHYDFNKYGIYKGRR